MIKNLQTHKMDLEGEVKSWSVTWKAVRLPKKKQTVNLRKSMLILKDKRKIADKIEKLKIAQRQLDIIEEKKNNFEAKAAMAEEKATEAEKKYNEVKAK